MCSTQGQLFVDAGLSTRNDILLIQAVAALESAMRLKGSHSFVNLNRFMHHALPYQAARNRERCPEVFLISTAKPHSYINPLHL